MKNIKVLLLEGIHKSAEETFHDNGYDHVVSRKNALDGVELIKEIADVHILGIRSRTKLTEEILDHAKELYAIGCFCIGTEQVALDAAAQRGIPVFNAPHANTRSVAELVIGYTIMLMRSIFAKSLAAHEGFWLKDVFGGYEIRGKVMGIVGYGHIGTQVSILAEALGMQVYYYDTRSKLPLGNAQSVPSLEELLEISDVITLHVPGDQTTVNMINRENLSRMKRGSFLINASRGQVVDIKALVHYLDEGHILGAALDVFPEEPKDGSNAFVNPLCGYPNVIISPHVGGSTAEAQHNIGKEVCYKLMKYWDRGNTEGAVNFPNINLPVHQGTHRILHIHDNIPGILQQIHQVIAEQQINVEGEYLATTQDVGYVVLDVDKAVSESLKETLTNVDSTKKVRIIY